MSGDGRRLSYYCAAIPSGLIVVDSTDGRVLGAVPARVSAHALDDDGRTRLHRRQGPWPQGDPTVYRRIDVATGALLAERSGPPSFFWGVEPAYDRRFGRLFIGNGSTVLALDATTLTEIGRVEGPAPGMLWSIVLDPERPEAYVAWWRYAEERYRQTVQVSRVSTETLAILESVQVPVDGRVIGLTLGPRPPALSDLNVVVDQRVATLTWTVAASRSIATGQVVEAGLTPGATAVRLPVAAGATSLTVPGVPPGRYYVRVRSANGTGLGTPSNEVVVDVP